MISQTEAADRGSLQVSVIIPTYCRPEVLLRCVESILAGSRRPHEIVIVGRKGDDKTAAAIAQIVWSHPSGTNICSAWVTEPGHVPPVEMGVRTASSDLVAIIDDDVTVPPGWLSSITQHFSDPTIAVVGGRVLVPGEPPVKLKGKPGCISWYGKIWGNLGRVEGTHAIEVDSVMEGNSIWRRSLLASLEFDPALNFDDASMYGLDLSLQAKKCRFRVIYDPLALVYHHPAARAPGLDRQERGRRLFCYCRNYTYIILKQFPIWRRAVFLVWWFLIGERSAWGLGSLAFDIVFGDRTKNRHVIQALSGKIEGMRLRLVGSHKRRDFD